MGGRLSLHLRRQVLELDAAGHLVWRTARQLAQWPAAQTGLLLCDVWDSHWSRGARERLEVMIPRMNAVVTAAREAGVRVVHAPSDTMEFYADHPARQRALAVEVGEPPTPVLPLPARDPRSLVGQLFAPSGMVDEYDPPLPVDAADHGTTTPDDSPHKAWRRQHPGIDIDAEADLICDDGPRVYACLRAAGIGRLLIFGVHTNMCVLHRTFAIKAMTKRGVEMALVRDLTDTMYSPARPPYVSHDEGTRLVVDYVEKFWCATVDSRDLLATAAPARGRGRSAPAPGR